MSIVESVKNITDVPATSESCVFGRCEVASPNLLSLNFVMFPLSVVCFAVLLAGLLWRWLQRRGGVGGSQELVASNPMQGENSRMQWEDPDIDWRPLYACAEQLADESSDEPELADPRIESPGGLEFKDIFGAEENADDIIWAPVYTCGEEHADEASNSTELAFPSAENHGLESEESSQEDDYAGVDYTRGFYKSKERDNRARGDDVRGWYKPEKRENYARDHFRSRSNPKEQYRPSVPFNLDTSSTGNSLEFTPSEPFRRSRPYVPAGIPKHAAAPTRTSLLREARAKAGSHGKNVPSGVLERKRGAGKKMNVSSGGGNVEANLSSTLEVNAEVALNTTFEMDKDEAQLNTTFEVDKDEATLNTTFEVDKAEAGETSGKKDPVGSEVNENAASPSTSGRKCCSECGCSLPEIWSPSKLPLSHEQECFVRELQKAEYEPVETPDQIGVIDDVTEEAQGAFDEEFRTSHLLFMQLMQGSLEAHRAQQG